MEDKNKVIGRNLYKIRKIRRLTQKQLGESVGISSATIGNYERGDRFIPGYLIHDLAKALDVPDQFISDSIPSDISRKDIANSTAKELLQKIATPGSWRAHEVSKQVQTMQLLHELLKDDYEELMLEEENDSNKVEELKQNIFNLFEELSSYGEFSDKFNDFDENFEVMYYTAMFFFNYLIEQKGINKRTDFFNYDSFIKKSRRLIDEEGYASDIVAYEYDNGNFE
ncbi:helix-turn-helix domain-containing protein [Lactobacillus agrestimuris]|uniref:helix-turn-helix domain-containing protein n=1 Tax=Lactobacillus agrestimuris TaxID=2941328 RepID=UPI002043DFC7|nr:helix-turn-helix domain-containing protein [Lactobacillus agrestimuris]